MDFNDYQQAALEFAKYPREVGLYYTALGLNGEAGEVAEKIKKIIRDNDGIRTAEQEEEIAKELGDVLWYTAMLAGEIGYYFTEIAQLNINKLQSRADRNMLGGSGDNR